jgi:rhamnose transport system ATP-binding protein
MRWSERMAPASPQLIKIFTGAVTADSGEMRARRPAHNSQFTTGGQRRMALLPSISSRPSFPELTVSENIASGLEQAGSTYRIDWKGRRRRASELLAQVGADIDPEMEAVALSMPQQQLVEIARALGADARGADP